MDAIDIVLGKLVKLIVTVPGEMLGALCDLAEKLASHRGGEWYEQLLRFLRREPCWTSSAASASPQNVEAVQAAHVVDRAAPTVQFATAPASSERKVITSQAITVGLGSTTSMPEYLNPVILVSRAVLPKYGEGVIPQHPELEREGLEKFGASDLELWIHKGQEQGEVGGQVLYDYLKENGMAGLRTCIGILEMDAIEARGVQFFLQYFPGKNLTGWKSVAAGQGILWVQSMHAGDGLKIIRGWRQLSKKWDARYVSPRFRSVQ